MRRRIIALLGIAVLGACSSSTAPAPTFIGTWDVKVSGFSPDTIEANPFSVSVLAGNGDTLTLSMPPLQWDHSPNYVFDSVFTKVIPNGATVTFFEKDEADQYTLALQGAANSARDTITGQIGVLNSTFTVIGSGTFVATKH